MLVNDFEFLFFLSMAAFGVDRVEGVSSPASSLQSGMTQSRAVFLRYIIWCGLVFI